MVIKQPCCKTGFAPAFECAYRTPHSESAPSYLPTPALHRVVSLCLKSTLRYQKSNKSNSLLIDEPSPPLSWRLGKIIHQQRDDSSIPADSFCPDNWQVWLNKHRIWELIYKTHEVKNSDMEPKKQQMCLVLPPGKEEQQSSAGSQVPQPHCPLQQQQTKKTQFHRSHSYSSLRSKEFIFLSPDKSAARNFIYSYFTDLVRIETVSISLLNWILQHFIVTLLK